MSVFCLIFWSYVNASPRVCVIYFHGLYRFPSNSIPTTLDRYTRQWYDKEYSECELLQGWDNILDLCKDKVTQHNTTTKCRDPCCRAASQRGSGCVYDARIVWDTLTHHTYHHCIRPPPFLKHHEKWNVFACDLKNEPHGDACWVRQQPWSGVQQQHDGLNNTIHNT